MENNKKNLYTVEEIIEFLYGRCTRCENKDCEKQKNQLKNYREQLLIIKNHKIDKLAEEMGIKF